MLNRILAACLVAGIAAGAATALLQHFTTTPLIIAAEVYEKSDEGRAHRSSNVNSVRRAQLASVGAHEHDHAAAAEWKPADGLERIFYSSVATIATAFGLALMLLSAMILGGVAITARTGLIWAAAAFVATGLAPGLGLAPELPGAAAADLSARQVWWIATVAATGTALWLALRISSPWAIIAGVVLIALPHVIGAPHPHQLISRVPAELAGHFASASLVVHAVTWALVGAVAGYLWQRMNRQALA